MARFDLIIVGAGPAGIEAARVAAEGGMQVLLLDDQPRPGGQIYRNISLNEGQRWLGSDYFAGTALVAGLAQPGITHVPGASVWRIEDGYHVCWSASGESHSASAPHIILATGAMERPVPFPGWTLPGVMPAGAAQIMMKQANRVPDRAVLAGAGPLLYLVAVQMIDAGVPPIALVETSSRRDVMRAARHLPQAQLGLGTLFKGFRLLLQIRKAGVRRYKASSDFRAESGSAGDIEFSFRSQGRTRQIKCRSLLTHSGVVPQTHLTRSMGIAHVFDKQQMALRPRVEEWGQTSKPGVKVAGDGSGIGGAEAACIQGGLAALYTLYEAGRISEATLAQQAAALQQALPDALSVRPFLDAAYPVLPEFFTPRDETIVCRCEDITAGAIREAVASGADGPRKLKTTLRTGMGPCQGRMCEATITGLLAEAGHKPIAEIDPARIRAPVKPVTLGELAALDPPVDEAF